MKKFFLMLAITLPCLMTSCIKDEAANKECDIESAWVEGEAYAQYFYDAAEMRKEYISSTQTDITFTVRSLISLSKEIPLNLKLTPGATVTPANGSMQDFTAGPVTYTVTSEDGQWQRTYRVIFVEPAMPMSKLSFENVEVRTPANNNGNSYHHFYEIDASGTRRDIWDSGNLGALMLRTNANPEELPTYSTSDGYSGKAVCLNTQSTGNLGAMFGKPIAAGNLFLGKFDMNKAFSETLKTTQFGIEFDREPFRVTGYYKYAPGPTFTDMNQKTVEGRVDEADIYAVFYRNRDAEGNPYYLYGDDVDSEEKLKANPQVYKIARVASLPPTDKWTRFEMFFEGRDADDELVKNLGFNLALVFSSSKRGAYFEGAVGSTLYVDEVEVSFEK